MANGKGADIAGAEKKLRQAEFFLSHLEHASQEMVHELARGALNPERLEYFFSACLSAAKSVYHVLETTGGPRFEDLQRKWREGLTNDPGKISFGRKMGLRDDDVHVGTTGATPLPKYVEEDHRENPYMFVQHNEALFGPAAVSEHVNPD